MSNKKNIIKQYKNELKRWRYTAEVTTIRGKNSCLKKAGINVRREWDRGLLLFIISHRVFHFVYNVNMYCSEKIKIRFKNVKALQIN